MDSIYFNAPIQLINGFLIDINVLNDVLYYACYDYCQKNDLNIESAEDYFGIELGNKAKAFKQGETLFNSLPLDGPKFGINKEKLFEFINEDKPEFDKVCLLAYLSLKSIIQSKPYCKIDNRYLLSRMDGKVCKIKQDHELSDEINKYNNEYQIKKIKNALILNWGLKHYSKYTRGFFVSFKMKLEDLIYQAELKRKTYKERELKRLNDDAYKAAMNRLNKSRP